MSTVTKIEWSDRTWGPVLGCAKVSPGCDRCDAIRTAHRCAHLPHTRDLYAGLTGRPDDGGPLDWTGRVTVVPSRLPEPLSWRKPQRVFVNSQSDLFHQDVPVDFIVRVLAVMAITPHHTYQVLSKRQGRMRSVLSADSTREQVTEALLQDPMFCQPSHTPPWPIPKGGLPWPLPNLHLGVSVEDQRWADIRIPALLETPAAVRWISAEPLLGPITLKDSWLGGCGCDGGISFELSMGAIHEPGCGDFPALSWVVCGGESGPHARPMHPRWARSLRDQCAEAGVPYHLKQWGEWAPARWKGEGGATHAFTGGFYQEAGEWVEGFMELGHSPTSCERDDHTPAGAQGMRRVGKKAAGRLLDGVLHDEFPDTPTEERITS